MLCARFGLWALLSGGSLEDWKAERETSEKAEALPSPPHRIPPGGLRFNCGPQGAESFPIPRAWAPGLFSLHPVSPMHRAVVASSGESSRLECSSAVLFFLGYSRGCGNSHRCGEGKPPSPLPRSWERGEAQAPWSWVGPATVVPGPGGLRAEGGAGS